jgi:hypothetical protein
MSVIKVKRTKTEQTEVKSNVYSANYYIVNHVGEHDDDIFKFSCIELVAKSKSRAWRKFLSLVGKDMNYWRKRGYRALPVTITAKIER